MFYTYRQNNSGGIFVVNDNVTHYVIIEANSPSEADERAQSIGIYFDGVEEQWDCSCCGDRWHRARGSGTERPEIYGEHPSDYTSSLTNPSVYVYYFDGNKEVF